MPDSTLNYSPAIRSLKFLFYFGWLRVAESLYNPFGDDDQDFEMNDLLDRHVGTVLGLMEGREEEHPKQCQNQHHQEREQTVILPDTMDNLIPW